ncbi:MAG: sugar transferase [Chlamydiales bacterium]
MSKRLFDIIFSLVVLLLLLPIFFLIGLSIKLTSRGPVFYLSKRIGKAGSEFVCVKFRTMYANADARLQEMLKNDPQLRKEWETFWKLKRDPRTTWIGRALRKTSLDELPQFWNVLKGELSVVGPRPVTSEEVAKYYAERAEKILSVRPGITGLWQTSGRSLLSFEERVRLEELYVDTRSFLLDLKLIAKTIPAMLFSSGAF